MIKNYILIVPLLILGICRMYGQVSGQVLWYKADNGVNSNSGVPITDNTQLTTWYDLATSNGSQNGVLATPHFASADETDLPSMPFYRYNSTDNFNFNPVVHFNATNNGQAIQTSTPTKGSQTVIVVFKSTGVTGGNAFYSAGLLYGGDVLSTYPTDAGDPALKSDLSFAVRSQSRIIVGGGSRGDFNVTGQVQLNNLPSIGTFKRNVVSAEEVYISMYASGTTEAAAQNVDPTNEGTDEGRDLINQVRIGKAFSAYENGLSSPFGKLDGSVAEVIVYNGVLSDADRAKVESYLAVKYGITLTGGTQQFGATVGNNNYNYVNSAGTIIRTSDLNYKFDIFGLGRDDYFGLNQRISKSVNPNDILTVSTNSDFTSLNLNATRTIINGNREFLFFANNKGSGDVVNTQTTELPFGVDSRFDREWKVNHFNTDGTPISNFSLRFNLTGISMAGANSNNVRLLIDSDGDGDFTTGPIQEVFASAFSLGNYVQFDNLNLLNNQVITVGVSRNIDSDGDGIIDLLDVDDDNDGILDTDECNEVNRLRNANFTVLPSSPIPGNFYSPAQFAAATNNNWRFTTTGTGPNAQIFWGNVDFPFVVGNAIRFQRDGQTQSIAQTLNGISHSDGVRIVLSKFAANNSNPLGNSSTLILSYAGIEFMRIVTANGMNSTATITYSGGASGSLPNVSVGTVYTDWVIQLPMGIPSSGELKFEYLAGPADSDDFSIGDITLIACQDTDGDDTPDYLDLDSDNDGCYDSLEGDGSYTTDDINPDGSINTTLYPINGNGLPGGTSQGIGESQNATIADCACPFASGIDSDGDGIDDVCDLDDDNDGILDTDECPPIYTVKPVDSSSITVSGTITNGTPQAIADGEGAGTSGFGTLWYTNVSYLPITFSMDMQVASVIDHIKLYGPWGGNEWIKSFRVRFYDSGNTLLGTEILTAPDQYLAGTSGIILAFSQEYVNVSHIEFTIISDQGYNQFYRVSVREIVFLDLEICDTDGDGIPNRLDLDSDNDGCFDAIEGAENVTSFHLNPDGSIDVVANGGVDADGVPNIVNSGGIADVGEDQGQGIGASQDELITLCFCTEDPNTDSPDGFTKVGVSTMLNQTEGWPDNIPNGWITMESKTKGFVITRTQHVGGIDGIPTTTDSIEDPQEGMLVYDIEDACVKLFNGTIWNCIERSCNTPTTN